MTNHAIQTILLFLEVINSEIFPYSRMMIFKVYSSRTFRKIIVITLFNVLMIQLLV